MPKIEMPILSPEIKISEELRSRLLNQVKEESQVIVHCTYTGTMLGDSIRIWKSTFLYAKDSTHKSKLVHHENITLFPVWTRLEVGRKITFTLIFSGLPKHCNHFDFIEKIPEPGGFEVRNIQRNNSDVYLIELL